MKPLPVVAAALAALLVCTDTAYASDPTAIREAVAGFGVVVVLLAALAAATNRVAAQVLVVLIGIPGFLASANIVLLLDEAQFFQFAFLVSYGTYCWATRWRLRRREFKELLRDDDHEGETP